MTVLPLPTLDMIEANGAWLGALIVAALVGLLLGGVTRTPKSKPTIARRWRPSVAKATRPPAPPAQFDGAEQLRIVERASFGRQRLMNRSEARLFDVVERACFEETPGWRVMAQVSLGEVLTSRDPNAYRAINSKRVDMLLIDADGMPLHAIEYQGSGHHVGPAATRDAVKREALRKAGVGYVEVLPGDTPADIRARLVKLSRDVRLRQTSTAA